jgi:hypothetical protein
MYSMKYEKLSYSLNRSLAPWSRVLVEKLKVVQLRRNSQPLMEPESSLPGSQELTVFLIYKVNIISLNKMYTQNSKRCTDGIELKAL